MSKFKKPNQYKPSQPGPSETVTTGPAEQPEVLSAAEDTVIEPEEYLCPVPKCGTRYRNAKVMLKHIERQHGIGGPENLNKPKPRDPNGPLDPEIRRLREWVS